MACLSHASHLGSLLLPPDAFQEYAAHRAEWSAALNAKGSERTCIRSGLATFLHCACTAYPDFVVKSQATDIIGLILISSGAPTVSTGPVAIGNQGVRCSQHLRSSGLPLNSMECGPL